MIQILTYFARKNDVAFYFQIKNQMKSQEQLKCDLQLTRSSYADEVARCQQDVQLLRDDLQLTRVDLGEAESTVTEQRAAVERLTESLEREADGRSAAVAEVSGSQGHL